MARRTLRVTKPRSLQSRAGDTGERSNVWALWSARRRRSWSSSSATGGEPQRGRVLRQRRGGRASRSARARVSGPQGQGRRRHPRKRGAAVRPWQTASTSVHPPPPIRIIRGRRARAIDRGARRAAPTAAQRHRSSDCPQNQECGPARGARTMPNAVIRRSSAPLLHGPPTPRAAPPRSPCLRCAHRASRFGAIAWLAY